MSHPDARGLRTMGMPAGRPLTAGIGMLFIAWWKAAALIVPASPLLVSSLGAGRGVGREIEAYARAGDPYGGTGLGQVSRPRRGGDRLRRTAR